eukprot:COSAG04_NODE_204_length_20429_cov_6.166896_7_plen_246_part_00
MGPPTALRTAASLRRQCSPNCRTQLWSCSPGRSLPSARRAVLAAGSATGVGAGQGGAGRLTCGPAAGTRRTGCRNRRPRHRAPGGPRSRPSGRSRSAGRWARGTRRRSGGLTGSVPQGVVSSAWRRTGGQRRSGGGGAAHRSTTAPRSAAPAARCTPGGRPAVRARSSSVSESGVGARRVGCRTGRGAGRTRPQPRWSHRTNCPPSSEPPLQTKHSSSGITSKGAALRPAASCLLLCDSILCTPN